MTANVLTAGRGRLAEVIASRGGKAAPEASFVIENREALIYMFASVLRGSIAQNRGEGSCGVR